jgi:hypothetical protein
MRSLPLLLLGCAVDLEDRPLPPPGAGGLSLEIDGMMAPGETLAFRVGGAQPGQRIAIVWGDQPAPCTSTFAGLCLDVDPARLLPGPPRFADGLGTARFALTVPQGLPDGRVLSFQAVAGGVGPAATSDVVTKFDPLDVGGTMTLEIADVADVTPGVSYLGLRREIYTSVRTGLDLCILESDLTSTNASATCAGCTFAFFATQSGFRDASVSGDCEAFFGVSIASLASSSESIGFQAGYPVYGAPVPVSMIHAYGSWVWLSQDASLTGTRFDQSLTNGFAQPYTFPP